jgi:hypothetical protein
MPRGSQLSTRSDAKELVASVGGALAWQTVLDSDSEEATWRIVEAFSVDGAPFALEVSWSAGAGAGPRARATISRSGRMSVFARGLRVRAANLSNAKNRIGVSVADGYAPSRNVYEVCGSTLAGGASTMIEIPPYAEDFVLEVANTDLQAGTEIRLFDGQGTLRAKYTGDDQLSTGIDVGGAGKIEVSSAAPVDFRIVFQLSL